MKMKTLGQIAHQACLAQVNCIDPRAWDELEPEAKQWWENIAKAVEEEVERRRKEVLTQARMSRLLW